MSFVLSPASACDSVEALTYVPMPPFQSRSTGARRISRISSTGESSRASISNAALTWSEIGIDFAVRGQTPPPSEMTSGS